MRRPSFFFGVAFAAVLALAAGTARADARRNALVMLTADGTAVQNCADPTVIRSRDLADPAWYMYCTRDPLGDWDKDAGGGWVYHNIPIFRSPDLVHWTYQGDALAALPAWAELFATLWAPEIRFFAGKYHLYYAVTDTKRTISGELNCNSDSAIGVATSAKAYGPFVDAGTPVVAPRRTGTGCSFAATIDPEVIDDPAGQRWIYYGSFAGGVEVRKLSADGAASDAASATLVAAAGRYEAPEVLQQGGWYYLLLSTGDCCSGPASGYGVVAARASAPSGPFVDRDGASLTAARAGGTPVLTHEGTRWVGPGHHTTINDMAGQPWLVYHAIDEEKPYFAGATGYTQRPAMLDPLDWIDGWPAARGGWRLSSCVQPAPVALAGGTPTYVATRRPDDAPGLPLPDASDEFNGSALSPQWAWIRAPAASAWGVGGGTLRLDTQAGELYETNNSAPVLVEPAPGGDFIVEAKLAFDVPASGCCYDFAQAGLVLYGDDDRYIKLVHVATGGLRQTEFAREELPRAAGYPMYGKSWIGPPGDTTWLRLVRRGIFGGARYTAYTSTDGVAWWRGATWRTDLSPNERIGLVSMNRAGYHARFDYVRVSRLAPDPCDDPAQADPCDDDLDGTGDLCDVDDDGDRTPDLADCGADDAAAGTPAEVLGVDASASALTWQKVAPSDAYDVTRAHLATFVPGAYGPCLASHVAAPPLPEPARPPVGDAFGYLVRGIDADCGGAGTWGTTSSGAPRANTDPAACP